MVTINVNKNCVKCLRCIEVCPAGLFSLAESNVTLSRAQDCIKCSHCVGICPSEAIDHSLFPQESLRPIDFSLYPTPEQLLELMIGRRSNRTFTESAIASQKLELITKAALLAPTASNTRNIKCIVITEAEKLSGVTEFTISLFSKLANTLSKPAISFFLKPFMKSIYRNIPKLKKLEEHFRNGDDPILRNAKALILFYGPKNSRFGVEDANLAYQNASLMAESLGLAHFYTGFVCSAIKQDKQKTLNKTLGINGSIYAGMALGNRKYPITKVRK